jgi:pimeloyl-ACP methyl ester carboxylesterase
VIAGLAFSFAATCAMGTLSLMARKVLFPAPRQKHSTAKGKPGVEVITLKGGTESWFLPAVSSSAGQKRRPVLIFTHGNGELIDHWLQEFREPTLWGIHVLLVEYPGYGRSEGTPTENSITQTMLAAYDYLSQRDDVDLDRVVAYGRSLGGGAAACLARERPLKALILESTFTSVRDLARSMMFPPFLILDPFDTKTTLREFSGGVLIIHGTEDEVIPFEHARELKAVAKDAKLISVTCGHNDCPTLWTHIGSFLQTQMDLPPGPTF